MSKKSLPALLAIAALALAGCSSGPSTPDEAGQQPVSAYMVGDCDKVKALSIDDEQAECQQEKQYHLHKGYAHVTCKVDSGGRTETSAEITCLDKPYEIQFGAKKVGQSWKVGRPDYYKEGS